MPCEILSLGQHKKRKSKASDPPKAKKAKGNATALEDKKASDAEIRKATEAETQKWQDKMDADKKKHKAETEKGVKHNAEQATQLLNAKIRIDKMEVNNQKFKEAMKNQVIKSKNEAEAQREIIKVCVSLCA